MLMGLPVLFVNYASCRHLRSLETGVSAWYWRRMLFISVGRDRQNITISDRNTTLTICESAPVFNFTMHWFTGLISV